jgi:hypothetical protein
MRFSGTVMEPRLLSVNSSNGFNDKMLGLVRDLVEALGDKVFVNNSAKRKLHFSESRDAGARWQAANPLIELLKSREELEVLCAG